MEEPTYHIETFEGPLDLLLTLIGKNKVNIADIPIALILEQYLAYLDTMEKMDMEITGDFIAMAAELMLIKSKMLLPKTQDDLEDPREKLASALLEYQKAKLAAEYLGDRFETYRGRFAKDTSEIQSDGKLDMQESMMLFELMSTMLSECADRKINAKEYAMPIVRRKYISVGSRIPHILALAKSKPRVKFYEFFSSATSRSEMIATFIALLELIKSGNFVPHVCENKKLDARERLEFEYDTSVPLPEIYDETEERDKTSDGE